MAIPNPNLAPHAAATEEQYRDLSYACDNALEACEGMADDTVDIAMDSLARHLVIFTRAYRQAHGTNTPNEPACALLERRSRTLKSYGTSISNEQQRKKELYNAAREAQWIGDQMANAT